MPRRRGGRAARTAGTCAGAEGEGRAGGGTAARRRRVVRRDVVLDHPNLLLRLDTERDAAGREHTYIWGSGPDIVMVVPVWPDGTVTLLSQRRYGMRARSIEVPGGSVEPGEAPAAAARRELREETGVVAREVKELLGFVPAVKLQQRFRVFLATGLRAGRARPDADEDVRVLRVPLDRAALRSLRGWIAAAPSIVALLAAYRALCCVPAESARSARIPRRPLGTRAAAAPFGRRV